MVFALFALLAAVGLPFARADCDPTSAPAVIKASTIIEIMDVWPFYLDRNPADNSVIMTDKGMGSTPLVFSDGMIGAYVNGCDNPPLYLTILPNATSNNKKLIWDEQGVQGQWKADFGQPIVAAANGTVYSDTNGFWACQNYPDNVDRTPESVEPPFDLWLWALGDLFDTNPPYNFCTEASFGVGLQEN